jgi:hypothetical protein
VIFSVLLHAGKRETVGNNNQATRTRYRLGAGAVLGEKFGISSEPGLPESESVVPNGHFATLPKLKSPWLRVR